MIGLVKNELMKIYSRRLTKIILLLLVVYAAGASVFFKIQDQPLQDWRAAAEQTVQTNKDRLALIELSPQLQADAENKLEIAQYRLEHNIPMPAPNAWSALLDLSGLVEMIIIAVIIIASEMVSREYTNGTIKLLLIRPHSRTAILLSKYLAVSLFALTELLLCAGSATITNVLLYGTGNIQATDLFFNQQGQIVQVAILQQAIKAYGFSLFPIMSYVSIAFAISTVLRNSALAVGSSLVLMVLGNAMIEATAKAAWLKYLPFANSDMSLYIFHLPARPEMTVGFSISVLLVYIVALFFLSMIVFKKRDVSI